MKILSELIPTLHRSTLPERIHFGRPVREVLAEEVERSGAQRVYVITTGSLSQSQALVDVAGALGSRFAGAFTAVRAHAPRACVLAGAAAARAARADLLLALGGGSAIDAAKVMLLALRHGYEHEKQLDPHAGAAWDDSALQPADRAQWPRMITIPTTFSAAEYTAIGGATEAGTLRKQAFGHPLMMPLAVINDPEMTRTAPLGLLLATGMKALDHAVERITSHQANLYSDTVSSLSLRLLSSGLKGLRDDPESSSNRQALQYAVFLSMAGIASGVRGNLAHALGHALGALCEVSHGHTSCVLLPAVLRWIAPSTPDRQRMLCEAMGFEGSDAAEAVSALVSTLGLPLTLRDVEVERALLPEIAERAFLDPLTRNCARPVHDVAELRKILEMAW